MSVTGTPIAALSTDFPLVRDRIIKAALRKVGAIAKNQDPSPDQFSNTAEALNLMIFAWQNKGIFLWKLSDDTITLIVGTANYTLGSTVLDVQNVFVRRSGNDTPITPMTREEYKNITTKTTQGLPNRYYLDRQKAAPVIYLWYTPENATDVVHYTKYLELSDFASGTDTPDFDLRWTNPLVWGLTVEIGPEYNVKNLNFLVQKAEMEINQAKNAFQESGDVFIAPAF